MLLVATRIHSSNTSSPPQSSTIDTFAGSISSLGQATGLIATDSECFDLVSTHAAINHPDIVVICVSPWGKFTPALNVIVFYALENTFSSLLLISAEVSPTVFEKSALLESLVSDTLVVGKRLVGHSFSPGKSVRLSGVTTPWNTMAMWNLSKLGLVGFPLVAEGVLEGAEGGVEEVGAIAIVQKLLGEEMAKAKLLDFSNGRLADGWDVSFNGDQERQRYHNEKMESKAARPQTHLELLNLEDFGVVEHLNI